MFLHLKFKNTSRLGRFPESGVFWEGVSHVSENKPLLPRGGRWMRGDVSTCSIRAGFPSGVLVLNSRRGRPAGLSGDVKNSSALQCSPGCGGAALCSESLGPLGGWGLPTDKAAGLTWALW